MKTILITTAAIAAATAVAVVWLQAAAPTIGPVTATPAYIIVNTPTSVVIAAQITDVSLIAGSVNLLRVDSTGKTLATVGVMRDDGTGGDARASDKTFSYRVDVSEPAVGQLYYRASAAFKGVLQRALSNTITVTVDPFKLPPDPGEPGKQTLAGIDSDSDGVRDDLQRFIAIDFRPTPLLRAALTQVAESYQQIVVNSEVEDSNLLAAIDLQHRALDCLTDRAGGAANSLDILRRLKAQILNTKARTLAYLHADARLSGHFFPPTDPATFAASCDP